jgi:hypothetical protein
VIGQTTSRDRPSSSSPGRRLSSRRVRLVLRLQYDPLASKSRANIQVGTPLIFATSSTLSNGLVLANGMPPVTFRAPKRPGGCTDGGDRRSPTDIHLGHPSDDLLDLWRKHLPCQPMQRDARCASDNRVVWIPSMVRAARTSRAMAASTALP